MVKRMQTQAGSKTAVDDQIGCDERHTCCSKPNAVDLSVMTDFADLTARTNSFRGASNVPISCSDCFYTHTHR